FAALNAGKHSIALEPADEARRAALFARADIALLDGSPRAHFALDGPALCRAHPALVVVSVSDFGLANERSHWQATDPVLHALSSALARSGLEGRAPLVPPGRIAHGAAASQAVYAVLVAYFSRLRNGRG